MGFVLGMQPAPGRVSCRTPLGAGWHQGGAQVATSGWLTKACSEGDTYQPPLERDGVDAEVPDQAKVVVHVLQAAQHLWGREQSMAPAHRPAATAVPGEVHGASQAAAPGPCPREPPPPRGPRKHSLVTPNKEVGLRKCRRGSEADGALRQGVRGLLQGSSVYFRTRDTAAVGQRQCEARGRGSPSRRPGGGLRAERPFLSLPEPGDSGL